MTTTYTTQNDLLLHNLTEFYKKDDNLNKMLRVVSGESRYLSELWIGLQQITQALHGFYTIKSDSGEERRFKPYNDYKLKLKAYSKKRFDPFCRWDRIVIPYKENSSIQTTIGQLNFFKWVIDNNVVQYIDEHYAAIESDMNNRNSAKKKTPMMDTSKTRKRREELSISASKALKPKKWKL